MEHLIIRKVENSELDTIVEMQLSLQKHLESCSSSVWRHTEKRRELLRQEFEGYFTDENNLILVVESGNQIVGFVHSTVSHRIDYLPSVIGEIHSIYVHEDFRRQGVGSRLVGEICEFFKSKNVESLYLGYVLGNIEGERFWKKLGFKPIIITAGTNIDVIEERIRTPRSE